ncbi:hypothetical protein BD408DRAFT_5220 [Parasitella parasitica]|nr:hypothetical protein BD408DRAFT_5220 [Parasitella parasitica]
MGPQLAFINPPLLFSKPSSLAGPPPIMAIAKAIVASTDVYTPPEPQVPLNSFYLPKNRAMIIVGVGMGVITLLAWGTDDYFQRQFPAQVLQLRNKLGPVLICNLWKVLAAVHLIEGSYALATCIRRGWYSPMTTVKWTLSSLIFGIGSLRQLKKHAHDVAGVKKTD